jgi:flagellar biosynthetic protein FliR
MSNSESTVFAPIYGRVFSAAFLIVGGHRALVRALLDTFAVIPPATFRADSRMTTLLVDLLTSSFELAVRLAAPVLIAMFLSSVALGLLSRSIPQLNILTVGFAIRAMMAIAIAAVALSASDGVFLESLAETIETIRAAFGLGAAEA